MSLEVHFIMNKQRFFLHFSKWKITIYKGIRFEHINNCANKISLANFYFCVNHNRKATYLFSVFHYSNQQSHFLQFF